MISRSPNKRASIEKAPGPRSRMAAATATSRAKDGLENRLGFGVGIMEIQIPVALSPVRAAANGVRNPAISAAPVATASAHTIQVPIVGSGRPATSSPPCTSTATPTANRKSSRPAPVRPSGNT
jgi:hypothetical protein